MSDGGNGRWLEFELPTSKAEHVMRVARRCGLVVEHLAMPRFRVNVTDAMQAYELGELVSKGKPSASRRRGGSRVR